jgi:predicted SprT family Zn-dependent metalloprotease
MASLIDVQKLAVELLNKTYEFKSLNGKPYSLSPAKDLGYTFKFDNAKRRFGCCNYTRKTISLSRELCKLNLDKIETRIQDCILHEIAHALSARVYGLLEGRGHGENWRQILLAIGGDGRRTYDGNKVNKPKAKYTLVCQIDSCDFETTRHRLPKSEFSCPRCHPKKFNRDFLLKVIQNH